MEGSSLSDSEFPKWAANYVLLCHITTRIPGRKYDGLLSEKGGTGFPYLAFMDADGNVLTKHQGERSVAAFTKTGETAKSLQALAAKAAAGDAKAKVDFFVLRADNGLVTFADARKEVDAFPALAADARKRVDAALLGLEVRDLAKSASRDPKALGDVGKRLLEIEKAKRVPADDEGVRAFWVTLAAYAEAQGDVAIFERSIEAIRKKLGESSAGKALVKSLEKRLETLKKSK